MYLYQLFSGSQNVVSNAAFASLSWLCQPADHAAAAAEPRPGRDHHLQGEQVQHGVVGVRSLDRYHVVGIRQREERIAWRLGPDGQDLPGRDHALHPGQLLLHGGVRLLEERRIVVEGGVGVHPVDPLGRDVEVVGRARDRRRPRLPGDVRVSAGGRIGRVAAGVEHDRLGHRHAAGRARSTGRTGCRRGSRTRRRPRSHRQVPAVDRVRRDVHAASRACSSPAGGPASGIRSMKRIRPPTSRS